MYQSSVPVIAEAFHDREAELARLGEVLARLQEGTPSWVALVGPRKAGKTSLLLELERRSSAGRVAFVVIDVFETAPVSAEFFRGYALRAVDRVVGAATGVSLEALAQQPAEYRRHVQGAGPFLALPAPTRAFVLELCDQPASAAFARACLDLPEQLARALDLRLLVAIDEFQELAAASPWKGGDDLLPMMRAIWQRHRRVAYAISGSARTMLTELVTSERSPFFQHFQLMEVGPFARADAEALLVDDAPRARPVSRALAARVVDVLGGLPFYLQLAGETLAHLGGLADEDALQDMLGELIFSRAGRLALYFEQERQRLVGRAASLAVTLHLAAERPQRLSELARAAGTAPGAMASYLDRLGDAITRDDDDRYHVTDPVFALWLRWRAPGGTAVPMSVVGDEGERLAAEALARMGFDLVYQARASRGAFDLLATRGPHQLGVQVKRTALPARVRAPEWKRMRADGERLGWHWVVAVVEPPPGEAVRFLDPARVRAGGAGAGLRDAAAIDNLLLWVDERAGRFTARRGRAGGRRRRGTGSS